MNSNNRFARILATTLIAAMVTSLSIVTTFAATLYPDIPGGWSKNAVQAAIDNGLLNGYGGKIHPTESLTRAQMVAIVNRAFGSSVKADIGSFTDVPSSSWYADDIAKAVNMQILFGYNNKITPDKDITREQAFAVIARALKLSTNDSTSLNAFSDKDQISGYFETEIAALVKAGYVSGSNGRLDPKQTITREEFAQVMYNIVKNYVKTASTYSTSSNGSLMVNVSGATLSNLTVNGDLIIGDGVGTGDVTLDHVNVTGRTIVRGGGVNSIHVINGSSLAGTVIVNNVNQEVRIVTDNGTTIPKIEAQSKSLLEGKFGDINVKGQTTDINLKGQANTLIIETANSKITVSGSVTTVQTSQSAIGTQIIASPDANISTIIAQAQGTVITGPGVVASVQAEANNITVSTPNTTVTAAEGVTGVVSGGQSTGGGTTTTTPVLTTKLQLNSVSYNGSELVPDSDGIYTVSKSTLTTTGGIQVSITGQDFYDFDYTMAVSVSGTGIYGGTTEQAIQNVPGSLMNRTYNQSFSSFLAMIDLYNQIINREGISQPAGVIDSFMSDFDGYLSRLDPGRYDVSVKASGATLMTIKINLVP